MGCRTTSISQIYIQLKFPKKGERKITLKTLIFLAFLYLGQYPKLAEQRSFQKVQICSEYLWKLIQRFTESEETVIVKVNVRAKATWVKNI